MEQINTSIINSGKRQGFIVAKIITKKHYISKTFFGFPCLYEVLLSVEKDFNNKNKIEYRWHFNTSFSSN